MALQRPHDERPVSEGDIHAYTDGSLAGERVARVRRYLAARPGEWHRILFYRRLNAQLRHSFNGIEGDEAAVSTSRRPTLARGHVAGSRSAALACMLAGAVLAWLAAFAALAISEPSAQILNDAAVMALTEAGNGASADPSAPGQASALGASPAPDPSALGASSTADSSGVPLADGFVPVTLSSAPAPFDFAPAGLRLVASGPVELGLLVRAQRWVYENSEGRLVVLLASRAWFARAEPQWSARRVGNLRLLGWTRHGERWVLAGDAQTRGLMRAADLATQERAAREGAAGNVEQR